jgi:hypothetical protein
MWLAVLLTPALVVFTVHLLLLAVWEWVSTRRVRRHVDEALTRGDELSLRRVSVETAEAQRDWPGRELWVLGKAVEIMRHRVGHAF